MKSPRSTPEPPTTGGWQAVIRKVDKSLRLTFANEGVAGPDPFLGVAEQMLCDLSVTPNELGGLELRFDLNVVAEIS